MSLAKRLKAHIKREGPLPLELFLEKAMTTTQDSYYAEADRFGRSTGTFSPMEIG